MTPEALREWRKARKLTQMDMALHIGVSLATYKRYESGSVRIPKLLEIYCEEH